MSEPADAAEAAERYAELVYLLSAYLPSAVLSTWQQVYDDLIRPQYVAGQICLEHIAGPPTPAAHAQRQWLVLEVQNRLRVIE